MTTPTALNTHINQASKQVLAWSKNPELMPAISDTFECHIFVAPLNPSEELQVKFAQICKEFGMRALNIGLNFENTGIATVLQSTKYYKVSNPMIAVEKMIEDAKKLDEHFEVVRLKLESLATNDGVPQTDDEAKSIPGDTYFEYHIKIKDAPATEESDNFLKNLSYQLTQDLQIRVPFSCNNLKDFQRFLNARTYELGFQNSFDKVKRIKAAVESKGYEIERIISEFIVYDTNKKLDTGWLEYAA
jgi:hypothetical protein